MADVSCRRLQRLKYYVDKDYLSDNFWVWDGAPGRIASNYKYNATTKSIVQNSDPGEYLTVALLLCSVVDFRSFFTSASRKHTYIILTP